MCLLCVASNVLRVCCVHDNVTAEAAAAPSLRDVAAYNMHVVCLIISRIVCLARWGNAEFGGVGYLHAHALHICLIINGVVVDAAACGATVHNSDMCKHVTFSSMVQLGFGLRTVRRWPQPAGALSGLAPTGTELVLCFCVCGVSRIDAST